MGIFSTEYSDDNHNRTNHFITINKVKKELTEFFETCISIEADAEDNCLYIDFCFGNNYFLTLNLEDLDLTIFAFEPTDEDRKEIREFVNFLVAKFHLEVKIEGEC